MRKMVLLVAEMVWKKAEKKTSVYDVAEMMDKPSRTLIPELKSL